MLKSMESPVAQAWDRSHSNELRTWLSCAGRGRSTEIYHEGCWACLSAVFQSFLTGLSLDLLALGFSAPSSPLSVCVISASQDIPASGERSHCSDQRDSCGLASASAVCSGGCSHVALATKGLLHMVLLP